MKSAGYAINYGAARGIGSAATAVASLVIGFIIARLNVTWMLMLLLLARVGCIISLMGYPNIQKGRSAEGTQQECCSIVRFFSRYRWYCASLIGNAFLGMFHAMTENYMIAIVSALGGDSSHVGTALFISATVGAPVIFFFSRVRSVISDIGLLKIAAVSFLVKSICLYFASSITTIYIVQLLQATSFAFLSPVEVYYASAKVRKSDMVKGQAFIAAAYALGCSAGNFAGGQLLTYGVGAMLASGIAMALAGTIAIFVAADKSDLTCAGG